MLRRGLNMHPSARRGKDYGGPRKLEGIFGWAPIRLDWFGFVLPALILNYFGQGALVLMLRKRSPARLTGCSRSGPSTQW